MAIHGLTLSTTKTYVSNYDPAKGVDEDSCTKFVLGPVDMFVTSQVFDRGVDFQSDGSAPRVNINQMNADYVRFGLRDIQNYVIDGKQVRFETEDRFISGRTYKVVTGDLMASLPREIMQELAAEIKDMSIVTQDEAKNS